jgi:signal transduction histidine kinase
VSARGRRNNSVRLRGVVQSPPPEAAPAPQGRAAAVPLRRRVLLLVAVGILPLALSAGAALFAVARMQQASAERTARDVTRALATAVDAELRRSISVVETLATSPTLDAPDLPAFYERARRVVAFQRSWLAIVLADRGGHVVARTDAPPGAALSPAPEPDVLEAAVTRRKAVVGNLAPGAPDWPSFAIYVPVVRQGETRFVAIALVQPEAIVRILTRQHVPPDWVISVFDRRGLRVARSRRHDEYLGTPAAPTLAALMKSQGDEGWGPTFALEGDPIYTAYSLLPNIGWSVATGIPAEMVHAAARRSAIALLGGLLLSLTIGAAAAFRIARGITQPMAALQRAAAAFGGGEAVDVPATRIDEIRRVGEALAAAAAERAGAEAEREALLRREQEARAAAERASRAKDEFLAMLGHELRNPLSAISNAVAVLEHADDEATRRRTWSIVARQTAHLVRLIGDLLDVSRAATGKIVLERRRLDLAATVEHALRSLELAGRLRGRRLATELAPAWVDADPTRLEQIVVNLVGNAVKFTRPDAEIRVAVKTDGGTAELTVADDGAGMTADLAARVFEPFTQGAQSIDRADGGLGIGLTLVRRLAEVHGGAAEIESAGPGRGTTVRVRLPAATAPARASEASRRAAPASGAARDILIVEDNEDARDSLREILELRGHRVRVAGDGPAGVEAAEREMPEVALIDIGLPGLDGYEVARRIRAAGNCRRPLLLAITGYGLPEDRERALAAGFDGHLVKPVDVAALETLLAG